MNDGYERLGADGDNAGLYVRFDPGFGLNVYIGHRSVKGHAPGVINPSISTERKSA